MSEISKIETQGAASGPVAPVGLARRRLIRAGFAAAPVVLSLSGRSAMATTSTTGGCGAKGLSPMAWNSIAPGANGNCTIPSHTVNRGVLGKSPGYWKPNCGGNANVFQGPWPLNTVSPFSGYSPNITYKGCRGINWNTGTKFNQIFISTFSGILSGVNASAGAATSISTLLLDNDASPVAIKLCCAYLNALTYPGYSMTLAEVLFLAANRQLVAGGPVLTDTAIRNFLDQTWD
jgi:hypothetical protein